MPADLPVLNRVDLNVFILLSHSTGTWTGSDERLATADVAHGSTVGHVSRSGVSPLEWSLSDSATRKGEHRTSLLLPAGGSTGDKE